MLCKLLPVPPAHKYFLWEVKKLFFSRYVVSDSLGPHGLQHSRLFCPPLSPGVCSISWCCYLTIWSSAATFSFCLQFFPALGSFPVSQLCIKWPEYWSFGISPSSEYSELISSISLHCSFKKAFLLPLAVLWNSAFSWVYLSLSPLPFNSLLSSDICKAFSDNHFAVLNFFFFGMVLIAVPYNVMNFSLWFFRYSVCQI